MRCAVVDVDVVVVVVVVWGRCRFADKVCKMAKKLPEQLSLAQLEINTIATQSDFNGNGIETIELHFSRRQREPQRRTLMCSILWGRDRQGKGRRRGAEIESERVEAERER